MVMSSSPHPNSRDRAETPSRLMASACITPLTSSQTSAVSEVSHVARHERIIRACGHVAMRLCKAARTHTLTRAHDPRRTPRRAPSSPTFLPLPEHALPLPRGCPLLIQLARSSYTSHAPSRCPLWSALTSPSLSSPTTPLLASHARCRARPEIAIHRHCSTHPRPKRISSEAMKRISEAKENLFLGHRSSPSRPIRSLSATPTLLGRDPHAQQHTPTPTHRDAPTTTHPRATHPPPWSTSCSAGPTYATAAGDKGGTAAWAQLHGHSCMCLNLA